MKKTRLTAVLLALLVVIAGTAFWFYRTEISHMKLTVNGVEMTGKDAAIIAAELAEPFDQVGISLMEGEREELSGTMADFGYAVDQKALENEIRDGINHQVGTLYGKYSHLLDGVTLELEVKRSVDEQKLEQRVNSENFKTARTTMSEGSVNFDEESRTYEVTEPIEGDVIDNALLLSEVKQSLDEAALTENTLIPVRVVLSENIYWDEKPSVSSEELHHEADALNTYAASKINYTFGSETVTLDIGTFRDWMSYDETAKAVNLDGNAVALYVQDMAKKYNTQWRSRSFQTTGGATVTFSGDYNEYGYRINESEEQTQLKNELASGQEVTREPRYYQTNSYGNPYHYQRNGVDDLAGTYVEINLTAQHLWFYKNGQLVIETDFVSGDVSKGNETTTGVFPIAFKRHPYTLSSVENGYSVDVQYWMPFYDGQGLHDASWRSSFGGDIYQRDGSHGCVNLPEEAAKTIYENADAGMAVVLYK